VVQGVLFPEAGAATLPASLSGAPTAAARHGEQQAPGRATQGSTAPFALLSALSAISVQTSLHAVEEPH
jgi:hypothetical protein